MPAAPNRVIQIFRAGDVGAAGARALRLFKPAYRYLERELPGNGSPQDLAGALHDVGRDDAVVLWLRPGDLQSLSGLHSATTHVWVSGEMGGLEHAPLPADWRAFSRMAYPVDLPASRAVRVDYALSWFRLRHIPVTSQKVQVDTYLACGILSETLNHITDAFLRDYLLERVETDLDHRVLTGYYPRLTLAPLQRFASKGGYVVRFNEAQGSAVTAVTPWLTP